MSHGFGYSGNINYFILFSGISTIAAIIFAAIFNLKKKKTGVPRGFQNFSEAIVEFLVNLIEPVLGEKLTPIALPFLGTFFIYILLSNVLLIVPHPFANPATGDISVTLALACICVFGLQIYSFFVVNGPKKTLKMWLNPVPGLGSDEHSAGEHSDKKHAKGKKNFSKKILGILKSIPMKILLFVFIVLKIVDNAARLLSLSLRLFGNIYGEHTILGETTAMAIARPALIVTLFIPFLILCFDVMVALIQAVVFTNLSLFYMKEEWGVHD
ncbi:MAG: F0F1 ATP synthase subunit A [bacterium]